MAIQHLRSAIADSRPIAGNLANGQLAINYESGSPGVYFKDDNGVLVKVGPVHIGTTAPNATPGGSAGNAVGEQWLDTTGGTYVFKVWDGSAWRSEAGEFVNVNGDTMTGALVMDNQQQIRFRETTANGTNYVAIQAPASVGADRTLTLPDVTGTLVSTGDTGSVTSTMIADGTIVDADVNASAAIAGTKISPNFGSQNVTTTGTSTAASFTPTSSTVPTNGVYLPAANSVALSTNGAGRLFVDASGNVGVGVASPAFTYGGGIEIQGAGSKTLRLERTGATVSALELTADDGITRLDTRSSVPMAFHTSGTERLRITSAGLVGIGTTTPGSPLHIVNSSAGTANGIELTNFTGNSSYVKSGRSLTLAADFDANSGATESYISFETDAVEKVRIDDQGRVGIGTTNPSSLLEVLSSGSSAETIAEFGNNLIDGGLQIQTNGNLDWGFNARNSRNLTFSTNQLERARIDSSGRLLVGTSSWSGGYSRQIIAGNTASTTGAGVLYLSRGSANPGAGSTLGELKFSDSNGSIGASIVAWSDSAWAANDYPSYLVFSSNPGAPATSPAEAMRINSAQELLIGYTSDNGAYKLQVNSQIFATSATIATSDGRYKENVAALDGCVDLVKALRPVSFDWKVQEPVTRVDENGETVVVREAHNFPDGKQVGFIAQEVEEVLANKPWLGSVIKQNVRPAITDADGNELAPEEEFLGIAEGNLVAVLTSALKDAIGEIESLKARVAALESA